MQRPEDETDSRSRPTSRRSSLSSASSRKNTIKKSPKSTSCQSTPKRVQRQEKPDFLVTGRKLLKHTDRANSLPGCRPSSGESLPVGRKMLELSMSKKAGTGAAEDDLSLDLTQPSEVDTPRPRFTPATTSTPKAPGLQQARRGSARSQPWADAGSLDSTRDSSRVSATVSGDSFVSSGTSAYRCSHADDWSSAESGASSDDPRPADVAVVSPYSRQLRSSRVSWSEGARAADGRGEWRRFWASYSAAPAPCGYDQCPTPHRGEDVDMADLDFSAEGTARRSPESLRNINNIIRNEGLHLTPRETQNLIKCAHILGNVLSKAINRSSVAAEQDDTADSNKETEEQMEIKRKMLSLNLQEQNKPLEVEEEKRILTATTQTDISLPNTKSAPRIFEKILRQLSKSSIDDGGDKAKKTEEKTDGGKNKEELQNLSLNSSQEEKAK